MRNIKKISVILTLCALTACHGGHDHDKTEVKKEIIAQAVSTNTPAATNKDELDYSVLGQDFPVLAEMEFLSAPTGCRLAKPSTVARGEQNYVFTLLQGSPADGETYYQVAVNGDIRRLKQTYAKDYGPKKIRYLQTVDSPIVDVLVEIETLENPEGNIRHKGIVGRIKAWDEDLPLLCDYNRIRVEGNCDI